MQVSIRRLVKPISSGLLMYLQRRLRGWHSSPSVGKGAAVGGVGTGLPLAFLLEKAHASPFDPHPLSFLLGEPAALAFPP